MVSAALLSFDRRCRSDAGAVVVREDTHQVRVGRDGVVHLRRGRADVVVVVVLQARVDLRAILGETGPESCVALLVRLDAGDRRFDEDLAGGRPLGGQELAHLLASGGSGEFVVGSDVAVDVGGDAGVGGDHLDAGFPGCVDGRVQGLARAGCDDDRIRSARHGVLDELHLAGDVGLRCRTEGVDVDSVVLGCCFRTGEEGLPVLGVGCPDDHVDLHSGGRTCGSGATRVGVRDGGSSADDAADH
nr:hypothetical protein [Curtobacterium sp. B8]